MALFDAIRAGASGASTGYTIERSARFNGEDQAHISRTPSSASNRRTMTLSLWIKGMDQKDTNIGTMVIFDAFQNDANRTRLFLNDNGTIQFFHRVSNSDTSNLTTGSFRDPTAWYHLLFKIDTTQSTASSRYKLFVNGEHQEDNSAFPSQNADLFFNSTNIHRFGLGGDEQGNENPYNGLMAEINFIDGLALDPSDFAETDADTGQYNPIKYTGSYGTNGFYLKFNDNSNNAALGTDSSGNGNDYGVFGLSSSHDTILDTPTNNFCTLNPLNKTENANLTDGNITLVNNGANDQVSTGTFNFTSGKWYFEMYKKSGENPEVGIDAVTSNFNDDGSGAGVGKKVAFRTNGGDQMNGNNSAISLTGSSGGQTGAGVIAVAVDMDNKKIWYSDLSGTFFNSGNPANGTNEAFDFSNVAAGQFGAVPFVYIGTGSGDEAKMNFGQDGAFGGAMTGSDEGTNTDGNGQGRFKYSVPSGFLALCSANLPDPAVAIPSENFNIVGYTGNRTARSITGVGFQPVWVWIKDRGGGQNHIVFDSVRGTNKGLRPDSSGAETTATNQLTSFDSDGFSLGADTNVGDVNYAFNAHVAWCWKAGTAFSNSAGSNSATIASSGSVNQSAGFSIVSYTGNATRDQKVFHGLNAVPKWFLIKRRDGDNWISYHGESVDTNPQQYYYEFQNQDAVKGANDAFMFDDISPDTNIFGIYSDGAVNANGVNIIAYVFAEVAGFSKFGHYFGNSDNDGTYIPLGFRPALVIVKSNASGESWVMYDDFRNANNPMSKRLRADDNSSEDDASGRHKDFYANGFKARGTSGEQNTNGQRYIYMAWARNPFKYARAR